MGKIVMNGKADETIPAYSDAQQSKAAGILVTLIKAIRPKQATKNLFLYAALVFAGSHYWSVQSFSRVTLAFLLFTCVSGSVYLLNDLLDVEQDREHPTKRNRPIASGALPMGLAKVAFLIFSIGGLAASFVLSLLFGIVVTVYFVLQVAYCITLKNMVLLDVFTIAAGFVLRTVAGGVVLHIHISHWLLLCSMQLALFLGFGKRRQELAQLGTGKHRAILDEYSLSFLDQMINVVAGVTIVCYSVYGIESETAHLHPHLWVTIPIVIYSVCRYLYLVYQKGWGGAPDEVLQKDRPLQVAIVLWFIVVMLLFLFDRTGQPFFGLA
jgi:4-hydroxybenzoate polyprenyltransferase